MTGLPPASWAVDPGAASAREVYPGLWRLRLPVPWHHVDHANAYAIPSRDGVVMVDCGIGGHSTSLEALERAAAQAGFALDQVSDLVLTHYHSDHIGLMGPIQRASGCTVWGHRHAEAFLAVIEHPSETHAARRAMAYAEGARGELLGALSSAREELEGVDGPARPDRLLEPGVAVPTALGAWEVIEAPGHCPSQVVLHQRERDLLFSADLLMPAFMTFCDVGFAADPIGDYLGAIERVATLGSPTGFAGHGRPATNVPELVDQYRTGIAARLAAVADAPGDTAAVTAHVFGDVQRGDAAWRFLETYVYLLHLGRVEHHFAEQLAVDHPADALAGVGKGEGRVHGGLDPR